MRLTSSLCLAFIVWAAAPAAAELFRVTKTADTADGACDADCSLREAVAAANNTGPSVILLPPGHYRLTRESTVDDGVRTGDLDVTVPLAIFGSGAAVTVLDGQGIDRVLETTNGASLDLLDLTIRGGRTNGAGGGIAAEGPLSLRRCVIADNQAGGDGGGVMGREIVAQDSTISGNVSTTNGAAMTGVVFLTNVTVSGNRGPFASTLLTGSIHDGAGGFLRNVTITGNPAGGIVSFSGEFCPSFPCVLPTTSVERSIVLDNGGDLPGCFGDIGSLGFNITEAGSDCGTHATDITLTKNHVSDLELGPLADNGGPVPTHSPLPGSPALDAAGEGCVPVDARGALRPADGTGDGTALCDIGAVEVSPACVASDAALCMAAGRFRISARWRTASANGEAHAVRLTPDTGTFWFFAADNVELTVKLLDGCGVNGRYWVFASGLTDVEVEITVEDTATGRTKTYQNPSGSAFAPRFDTAAFSCT